MVSAAPAVVPPGRVKLPDNFVVLAAVFVRVSPMRSVSWVVVAPPSSVARPVTESVLPTVAVVPIAAVEPTVRAAVVVRFAVVISVVIVVAAWEMPALTKITARARMMVRVALPRLLMYILMRFINK